MKTERVVRDLKNLVSDAEDLVEATANDVTERAKEARKRLQDAVLSARKTCDSLQEKALVGAKAADQVVREHPYESLGVAFGVGVLIGVLAAVRLRA